MRSWTEQCSIFVSQVKASDFQSSTKIEALLDEINQMISGDPSAKAAPQRLEDGWFMLMAAAWYMDNLWTQKWTSKKNSWQELMAKSGNERFIWRFWMIKNHVYLGLDFWYTILVVNSIKLMLIYFYVRFPLARNHESQSQLQAARALFFLSLDLCWSILAFRMWAMPGFASRTSTRQSMFFIHKPLDKRSWPYQKVAQDFFFKWQIDINNYCQTFSWDSFSWARDQFVNSLLLFGCYQF